MVGTTELHSKESIEGGWYSVTLYISLTRFVVKERPFGLAVYIDMDVLHIISSQPEPHTSQSHIHITTDNHNCHKTKVLPS